MLWRHSDLKGGWMFEHAYRYLISVGVLWRHSDLKGGWMFEHAYRYQIIHKPDQDLIHVKLWEEGALLLDTGDVIDSSSETLRGGRLGVFCMSQEDITWSALTYRCG